MDVKIEKIPPLYRGDSVPSSIRNQKDPLHRGRTFAEKYLSEGLMAKSADGALVKHLELNTDFLISTHIGYKQGTLDEPSLEEWISKHSPFISFSSKVESAMHFVDRTHKKPLEKCEFKDAKYFLWELKDLPCVKLKEGLFAFLYKTSSCNVQKFVKNDLEKATNGSMEAALSILPTLIVHGYLDNDESWHQGLLIDVVTYLTNNPIGNINKELKERALERANKWSEWLLYPTDPMPDGKGFSARFSPNKHLDLKHCYRVK